MTRITVTQENKEFYKAFKKALNSKDETLTSFCEKVNEDYMLNYQRLISKSANLIHFRDAYKSLGMSNHWNEVELPNILEQIKQALMLEVTE